MTDSASRQAGLPAADLDAALRRLRCLAPPAPDFVATLGAAGARRERPSWRLAPPLRAALALLLCAAAGLAWQVGTSRLTPRLAALTPLSRVNAAWSAAEGYVLDVTVLDDARLPAPDGAESNLARLEAAVYAWADRRGLTRPVAGAPWQGQASYGLFVERRGGGALGAGERLEQVQLTLRQADAPACDELAALLEALPGVGLRQVALRTLHFTLGGMTPALENAKVYIDGTAYSFPEDFDESEAQQLYWQFSGVRERGVTFLAFRDDLLRRPDGSRRFALGDVVRVGLTPAGDLTLDTVRAHWDAPHGAAHPLTRGVASGWGLSLPPGVDEREIDPVAELARRFNPRPGDVRLRRYAVSLHYWLVPRQQAFTQGAASFSPAQRARAATEAAALQAGLHEWIARHPEVRRSLVWHDRVRGETLRTGTVPVLFAVSVDTDDLAEAAAVKAALAGYAGPDTPIELVREQTSR